jgi:hypothetical protein
MNDGQILKYLSTKQKTMAFCGKWPLRSKLILDNQPIEQVSKFKYLGCQLSYKGEVDVNHKLDKFIYICGTIKRDLKTKQNGNTLNFIK